MHAERLHDAPGHLRGAQFAARGHSPKREPEAPGELLLGKPRRHRRIGGQEVGLEAVEHAHQLLDRLRYGKAKDPVYPDRDAGGDLPGHVRGGDAHDGRDPQPAGEPGPNPGHLAAAKEWAIMILHSDRSNTKSPLRTEEPLVIMTR